MKYVDHLQWRYATKKYDATKKVPEEKIEYIKRQPCFSHFYLLFKEKVNWDERNTSDN